LHVPTRGEIVVFRPPTGKNDFFIKRVIGLPGETVIVKDGVVTILDQDHPKGYRLDESTYLSGIYTPGEAKVTLSSDEFFLMGDNRSVSLDSRSFGAVPQKNIVGKVWVRGWPIERIGSISTPAYSKE
jgi:signal peptidase I